MKLAEKLLLRLEASPWDLIYRAFIGFLALAIFARVKGELGSEWLLIAWLLCVLAALRVGLSVTRRIVPFSDATKRTWARRRGLTKLYDSYQWQKLRGVGLGLLLYIVVTRQLSIKWIATAAACMLFGMIASLRWSHLQRHLA
jgi:hypothetical protein